MKLVISLLLACVLGVVAVGVAAAKAPVPKKKPAPAKLTMCQLGQITVKFANTGTPVKCAPNPMFSKDVCTGYLPQVQALGPDLTIVTGGNTYGPATNSIHCFFKANGKTQAFGFYVIGGKGFHTNSLIDTSKQIDLQQAFEENYDQYANETNDCSPPVAGRQKTTVEGFEAYTLDWCPATSNGVATGNPGGHLEVLAGDVWVTVFAGQLFNVTNSSQLIPFAEQLIAKYH